MTPAAVDVKDFDKGSGFHAYLEEVRREAQAAETGMMVAAEMIYGMVRSTSTGLYAPQARHTATRIAKPLRVASGMYGDIARLALLAYRVHSTAYPKVHAETGKRQVHNPYA